MRSEPDRALAVAQLFSRRDRQVAEGRLAARMADLQAARATHAAAIEAQAQADAARRAPRDGVDVRGFDAEQRARARAYERASLGVAEAARRLAVATEAADAARGALAEVWARDEAIRRTRARREAMRELARRRRGEDVDAARD